MSKYFLPFALALILSSCANFKYNSALKKGYAQHDPEKRIRALTKAIDMKPSVPETYYYRGVARYKIDQVQSAIEDFDASIARYPSHAETYADRGRAFHILGEGDLYYDKIVSDYLIARILDKNFVFLVCPTNETFYGLPSEDHAMRIYPSYGKAIYKAGKTGLKYGKIREACELFTISTLLDPTNERGFKNLAQAYLTEGKYLLAVENYDKAIALNPMNKFSYTNKGNAHIQLENYDEAILSLERAIAIDSTLQAAWSNMGLAYLHLKKYPEAISSFDQAIYYSTDFADAYFNRGITHFALKAYHKAVMDYSAAIALDPMLQDAYINRGIAYSQLQEYDLALKDYDFVTNQGSTVATCWIQKAYANFMVGQYETSISDYLRAEQYGRTDYGNQAWVYYLLGQYENCIKYSQKAVMRNDQAYYAKYNIALSTLRLGKGKEAIALYQQYHVENNNPNVGGAIQDLKNLITEGIFVDEATYILENILQ